MTPHEFLDALMSLAGRHRFRETSGYRAPASNAAVGGKPFSAHQYWLGRDVILEEGEKAEEFKESARRLGLFVLDEGDHFHLQPRDWRAGGIALPKEEERT